jgi:hypothetical protein
MPVHGVVEPAASALEQPVAQAENQKPGEVKIAETPAVACRASISR